LTFATGLAKVCFISTLEETMFGFIKKRKFKILSAFVLLCFSLSHSVSAASDVSAKPLVSKPTSALKLANLLQEASHRSPEIIAAKANWLAHEKRIGASWAPPDPVIGLTLVGQEVQTRVGPQDAQFSVSQRIPFPLKLWERRKIVDHQARAAYMQYLAVTRDVFQRLSHAYHDLYVTDASIDAIDEIHELLKKFEGVAQARYSRLGGAQRDVAKAQAEVSLTLEQLFRLRQRRESIAAFINAVLDRDPQLEFGSARQLDLPKVNQTFLELVNHAEINREEIKAMDELVKKAKHGKRLAWLQYMPDVDFGFNYTQVGSGETTNSNDGQDSWMFPLKITIPLWQNRVISEIGEAKKRLEEADAKLSQTRNETFYQTKDAYLRFDTASRIATLYKTAIIPQAKLALTSDQAGYESEKTAFLDLLDSERVYLNAKLSHVRVHAEALKSYVDLERATGMDFMEEPQ
jgi:outer membrane protein, heavy metal efflux system